jgi:glycosyltransferase involved in cell wall biosynthesis
MTSSSSGNDVLKKINIKKPYLLYVGNAYPHKNLEQLVWAFEKLTKDYQKDLHLVLVGELDYFYKRLQDGLKEGAAASSHQRIIFTDFISDEDLAVLYQNASLYIFPSLCEGFGLPPLEAMTYRLPVVCSEAACLPEVLKEAAVYFNPTDIEDMAKKIKRVLEDKKLQEKLADSGSRIIQKYSWAKMAQQTLKIYKIGRRQNGRTS